MTTRTLHIAALTLIQRFVERQKLVLTAMQELRPNLLFLGSYSGEWTSDTIDEYRRATEKVAHIPQGGYWGDNNEWRYFIHGGGCRLVHTVTGEPINWDAPQVERFDRFWFRDYLEWLFDYEPANAAVTALRVALPQHNGDLQHLTFTLLEQLHQLGKLSGMDDQNKYVLHTLS